MKISQMITELQNILQEQGDLCCYVENYESGYFESAELYADTDFVRFWDKQANCMLVKKSKGVFIY